MAMTAQRKKPTPRKTEHKCLKEETLNRHTEIMERSSKTLYGNGTPEDGLLFMFREFLKEDERNKEDISHIKDKIDEALECSTKTAKALAIYKAEMGGVAQGKKETDDRNHIAEDLTLTKKRDNRFIVFQIIALILTLAGVSLAAYFGFRNGQITREIKAETTITNDVLIPSGSRGKHYDPFASDTKK